MFKSALLFIVLFSLPYFSNGQKSDSVFTEIRDGRLFAIHLVKKGEQIYDIAQQYNVPAVVLGQNNDISFYESLEPQKKVLIPLANYNYLKAKPSTLSNYKTLYYKVLSTDDYSNLSETFGVSEQELKAWNNNKNLGALVQKYIIAGWVLIEPKDMPKQNNLTQDPISPVERVGLAPAVVVKKDTSKLPPTELEKIYNYQTSNGQFLDSTSGMVVFFKPQTNIDKNLLYAFSNDIAKGRVLKIVNPSNGKFVFAKIIGPLPNTKQYINAKLGLDGRARSILETREVKLWCDFFLKY